MIAIINGAQFNDATSVLWVFTGLQSPLYVE